MTLTQARLKELLRYDPGTGLFTRQVRSANSVKVGDIAGSIDVTGYRRIYVQGRRYLAHRLAWLLMTGEWPLEIDHINGEKADNRWSNLREVTHVLNGQNRLRANRNNKTGLLGVSKHRGHFRAAITVDGRRLSIGDHDTAEEAHAAYLNAKCELQPGCSRWRSAG